jgi:H+/Cl- antiporter ClcA
MVLENKKNNITILKWVFVCLLIGSSGSASAFLLVALEWAANYRDHNSWIIWLPIAGLIIGLGYHYYGSSVVKGNNLLLEEYESPKYNPFKNGSFGPFGTIITHLLADQQVVRNSGTNGWSSS